MPPCPSPVIPALLTRTSSRPARFDHRGGRGDGAGSVTSSTRGAGALGPSSLGGRPARRPARRRGRWSRAREPLGDLAADALVGAGDQGDSLSFMPQTHRGAPRAKTEGPGSSDTLGYGRVETRELAYFVAVAEELHFGRAAAAPRHRPAAAVPGDPAARAAPRRPLLERTRRGVALTPAGEVLLGEGRGALDAVAAAARRTRRAGRRRPRGWSLGDEARRLARLLTGLLDAYAAEPARSGRGPAGRDGGRPHAARRPRRPGADAPPAERARRTRQRRPAHAGPGRCCLPAAHPLAGRELALGGRPATATVPAGPAATGAVPCRSRSAAATDGAGPGGGAGPGVGPAPRAGGGGVPPGPGRGRSAVWWPGPRTRSRAVAPFVRASTAVAEAGRVAADR